MDNVYVLTINGYCSFHSVLLVKAKTVEEAYDVLFNNYKNEAFVNSTFHYWFNTDDINKKGFHRVTEWSDTHEGELLYKDMEHFYDIHIRPLKSSNFTMSEDMILIEENS